MESVIQIQIQILDVVVSISLYSNVFEKNTNPSVLLLQHPWESMGQIELFKVFLGN